MVYRYGLADSPEILNGLSSSCERTSFFNELLYFTAVVADDSTSHSISWRTRRDKKAYLYQVSGQFQHAICDHKFFLFVWFLLDL